MKSDEVPGPLLGALYALLHLLLTTVLPVGTVILPIVCTRKEGQREVKQSRLEFELAESEFGPRHLALSSSPFCLSELNEIMHGKCPAQCQA